MNGMIAPVNKKGIKTELDSGRIDILKGNLSLNSKREFSLRIYTDVI